MIIRDFDEAEEFARKVGPKKVSVLKADNREFLLALKEAHQRGYIEPVIIGDEEKIRAIAEDVRFDISKFAVINSRDPQEIADRGVSLFETGETQFILRGYIDGPPLYRSLIKYSHKKQISACALMKFPGLPKLIGLTDTGLAVAPDFKAKIEIIKNALELFYKLGCESPTVGIIAAQRELHSNLRSVSDAVRIKDAFEKGDLSGCRIVTGLSISDFLLGGKGSLEEFNEIDYSQIPDILLVHNLESGNIFVKIESIAEKDFFSGIRRHGIILGSGIPTVVPSRSDSHETIITDIALGVLIS